jgi:hypothetical protein
VVALVCGPTPKPDSPTASQQFRHFPQCMFDRDSCSTLGFMSPYNHSLLLLQVMGKSHTSIMVTAGMLAYAVVLSMLP